MSWLVDDVILIELKQDYLAQGVTNTLFYQITDIVGTPITNDLLDLLIEFVVDAIVLAQNDSVSHIEQIISNLTDGISQYLSTYAKDGDEVSTQPLASFIALGMKKSVASRVTRPGSIRIVGQTEPESVGNTLEAAYVTIAETLGDALADTKLINDGAGTVASFNPVVVGRAPDGSFDLLRINDITGVGLPRLTTQNSRKPER